MRMHARKASGLMQLAEMRLPLIALIDVILFLLMYFLLAGSLEGEERELAAALAAGPAQQAQGAGFAPQVIEVTRAGDGVQFRIGVRTAGGRDALAALLRDLPRAPGVVVRVADDVPVAAAAAAVQACRDAGFAKIAYQASKGK